MKKIILPILVIIDSVVLLIYNIIHSNTFNKGFWMRSISSVLLIIAMIFTIVSKREQEKK